MKEFDCPYMKDATALAHEKGLLAKNQILTCDLRDMCTLSDCEIIKNPNFRTMYIKQVGADIHSPVESFYSRLEKWKNRQINKTNQ